MADDGGFPYRFTVFVFGVTVILKVIVFVPLCYKRERAKRSYDQDSKFLTLTMGKFLSDMEREKPIRFSSQQLGIATRKFSQFLGLGSFGTVYKGSFENGTEVAVKVLKGYSGKIEKQFMAEVSTIGRTHHINLVRLYGFCYERNLQALVFEYMVNGSLDTFLFHGTRNIEFEKLYEIAVGIAKGIAYLHEDCQQRIIHYDIKPGNILLDANFTPKVADFGLAKLSNRDNTHVTMTDRRGTPGYAAPELWQPFQVTHKCDVYSYGMLLFEIIGKRRNTMPDLPESQQWYPKWVWCKFEMGEVLDLFETYEDEEDKRDKLERMVKVALWCVQYKPIWRPFMSVVVKMLEGGIEIPFPVNPFQHLDAEVTNHDPLASTTSIENKMYSASSQPLPNSSSESTLPVSKTYSDFSQTLSSSSYECPIPVSNLNSSASSQSLSNSSDEHPVPVGECRIQIAFDQ